MVPPVVEPNVTPAPPVTSHTSNVRVLVERYGSCILDLAAEVGDAPAVVVWAGADGTEAHSATARDSFKQAAETIPERIFGELGGGFLLAKSGSVLVPHDESAQSRRSALHCDAVLSYGEQRPDYLFLLCASASEDGGANFLVDGFAALEGLRHDPNRRWVAERLESTTLELTTTHEAFSADGAPVAYAATRIVRNTPTGRKQLLPAVDNIKSLDTVSEVERALDTEMLFRWREALEFTRPQSVSLRKGQLLVVDNYRCFHGREMFTMEPTPRAVWQKWMWTTTGCGLPFGATPASLSSESTHAGGSRFNPAPRVKPYRSAIETKHVRPAKM